MRDIDDKPALPSSLAARVADATTLLADLANDPSLLATLDELTRRSLPSAAGLVSRPDRTAKRRLAKAFRARDKCERRAADAALVDNTGLRRGQRAPVFLTLPAGLEGSGRPKPKLGYRSAG